MTLQHISAPRFGGCRNMQSGMITKCVLSPSSCPLSTQYVKAQDVEEGICNSPSEVSTGRCASSVDDKVCSSSASACQMRALFEETESCNVIQDTASDFFGASTLYPHCGLNTDTPHCVISEDDCVDDTFYPLRAWIWVEPCTCDEVPTGMCYLKDVFPITKDSSFCAVGPYDCPDDTYVFMSAKDLFEMRGKAETPRICNLCHTVDIVKEEAQHTHVVESGGCFSTSKDDAPQDKNLSFIQCVLQSTDCPPSTQTTAVVFKSSVEMRELNHVPCSTDEITTGRCFSNLDQIDCTGDASACYLPTKFEPSLSCTLHSNLITKEPAYFGMCRGSKPAGKDWREQRCVWSESECADDEIWWHARLPKSDGSSLDYILPCTCENVETGGCAFQKDGATQYHCAVSEFGCDDPSSYLTTSEMKALGFHCKLCQPRRNGADDPTPSPTSEGHGDIMDNGGRIPGSDDNTGSYIPGSDDNTGSYNDNSLRMNKGGNVALGIFLGLLIVSIPAFAFVVYHRRKSQRKVQQQGQYKSDEEYSLPPSPVKNNKAEVI